MIALENIREGCVRETLGAAVALYRASSSSDPTVARSLRAIAKDEIGHAKLSWELAEWLDGQLTPRSRAAVRKAFLREVEKLKIEMTEEPSPELVRVAGAPSARAMRDLFARLERDVWAAAEEEA